MPKYIIYSGDNSNMNPLLRVFNEEKYKFTHVNPGASIYIEYTELLISNFMVRITFNNDLKEKSEWPNREPIIVEGCDQTEDGSMTFENFEAWLVAKTGRWETELFDGLTLE